MVSFHLIQITTHGFICAYKFTLQREKGDWCIGILLILSLGVRYQSVAYSFSLIMLFLNRLLKSIGKSSIIWQSISKRTERWASISIWLDCLIRFNILLHIDDSENRWARTLPPLRLPRFELGWKKQMIDVRLISLVGECISSRHQIVNTRTIATFYRLSTFIAVSNTRRVSILRWVTILQCLQKTESVCYLWWMTFPKSWMLVC